MISTQYTERRSRLEEYFDRTAADTWAKLTSTAKVSKIRETVRAGRDRMRAILLGYLPPDLRGLRLLDAGCGTGALAVEAARRGAEVVAVDISASLLETAHERLPADVAERIDFRVGDMLDPAHGSFDYVVSMDSLIHYEPADTVAALESLAQRTRNAIAFTFAPATPMLSTMHAVGTLFPRSDRAPAIVPVGEQALRRRIAKAPGLEGWRAARSERVSSGFYTSQAMELAAR